MKAYFRAHLPLLPKMFYLAGLLLGWAEAGAAGGLAIALARAASLTRRRSWRPFELAVIPALALILAGHLVPVPALERHALVLLFGFLAAGAAVSLAIGRPWTADISAADHQGATATPLFLAINRLLSALWAGIFAWLALAGLLDAPGWLRWGPLALGAAASVLGPRLLVRRGLHSMIQGEEARWPAPALRRPAADPVRIVGAGLGGLTAAALLADAGIRVSVHDQHDLPGGFAHSWPRRARGVDPVTGQPRLFRFDSGVHDISGWQPGGPVRSVFERLGIADAVEMRRLDHRYWDHGAVFDVPRDYGAHMAALAARHPQDAAGLAALFAEIRAIYEAMFSTGQGRGGIPGTPPTPAAMLAFSRAHPLAAEWMARPWAAFLDRHMKDAAAKAAVTALSGYLTEDPATLTVRQMVPIFGYALHGGVYPVGGSGRFAEALVGAIRTRGGEVHLRQPVARIAVADGRASGLLLRDRSGELRAAPASAVVLNGDPILAGRHLLPTGALAPALAEARPACSAVAVHLGIAGTLDMPPVLHARTRLGDIAMVAPSVVDPGCAPAGHATLELLALLPQDEAASWMPPGTDDPTALEAWRRTPAYRARKVALAEDLIARAAEVIPDLAARILCRADASPVTYARYAWTAGGSIYGTSRTLPTKQPLPGLVLAGAATHGAGVEAVVISGALAAEALLPGLLGEVARPRLAA
ncbi:NAD(P)/FAD-dependent oxidoreductase [Roseomonas sp. CAU 1739]|uniref:phytoene desaturase family protein n=1 Tax=Roseomonas sp. CAU 1739 TaxID=3140364 RepID=UPI00325A99A9